MKQIWISTSRCEKIDSNRIINANQERKEREDQLLQAQTNRVKETRQSRSRRQQPQINLKKLLLNNNRTNQSYDLRIPNIMIFTCACLKILINNQSLRTLRKPSHPSKGTVTLIRLRAGREMYS